MVGPVLVALAVMLLLLASALVLAWALVVKAERVARVAMAATLLLSGLVVMVAQVGRWLGPATPTTETTPRPSAAP